MSLLPEKYFYTIGDVCKLTSTKPHILRYWESQFKLLRPVRRYSGHRKFTKREIDLIQKIKYLVIDRKFTLAGAKRELNRQMSTKPQTNAAGPSNVSALPLLQDIKKDVEACLEILGPEEKQSTFQEKSFLA